MSAQRIDPSDEGMRPHGSQKTIFWDSPARQVQKFVFRASVEKVKFNSNERPRRLVRPSQRVPLRRHARRRFEGSKARSPCSLWRF
jgi:hypothetical protein